MIDFLKRNVKFVVTIGVSVLVVAGLSTALLVTNIASASDRGRDRRDRGSIRMEHREKCESRERGAEKPELTEEQIAERIANMKEKLEQRLADGKITQEEYDEKIAALDSGEYPIRDRSKRGGGNKGFKGETPTDED